MFGDQTLSGHDLTHNICPDMFVVEIYNVCLFIQTEVIVASSEVDDVAASNQVDCTIDMLIAAASQQSTVSIL